MRYAETHHGQEGNCYHHIYIGRAEGVCQRMLCWASRLEIALVEGYNCLKRPSREGAEGKESADLILLIHSAQAKLPGRASTVEKAQKCVWWGILKIFWAQQDLKITKTIRGQNSSDMESEGSLSSSCLKKVERKGFLEEPTYARLWRL